MQDILRRLVGNQIAMEARFRQAEQPLAVRPAVPRSMHHLRLFS